MKKLALFLLFSIPALAQVAVTPYRTPRASFTTSTGLPLSGGCVFTYQGGTTTPQATYTDSTGGTSNPNPVILDTTGSAVMWLGPNNYKFSVYSNGGSNCISGSLQYTVDQVTGNTFTGAISGATITGSTISGGTIDNTPIGSTTPAPVNGSYLNGPIGTGGGTPAAGAFSSLATAVDNMSFSSTPVFDAGSYGYFSLTLTGNVTSSTVTGGQTGQEITFNICQDNTGGRTFAWPATLFQPGTGGGTSFLPGVTLTANACTVLTAYNNGFDWIYRSSVPQFLFGVADNLTFSSTPVFNLSNYSAFTITLTGNVSSSTFVGGAELPGLIFAIQVCQDATGGRTFVWPTNLLNAPPISAAPNACTGIIGLNDSALSEPFTVISSTIALPAFSQTSVALPVAPASATLTMQGMGAVITPGSTGRVHVQYSAGIACSASAGDGIQFAFYYGTGTPPANAASTTGTLVGTGTTFALQAIRSGTEAVAYISRDFFVTGLTPGTAYWFDAAAAYSINAGCGARDATITLQEF